MSAPEPCAEAKRQLSGMTEMALELQRIVEALCRGHDVPPCVKATYHFELATKAQAALRADVKRKDMALRDAVAFWDLEERGDIAERSVRAALAPAQPITNSEPIGSPVVVEATCSTCGHPRAKHRANAFEYYGAWITCEASTCKCAEKFPAQPPKQERHATADDMFVHADGTGTEVHCAGCGKEIWVPAPAQPSAVEAKEPCMCTDFTSVYCPADHQPSAVEAKEACEFHRRPGHLGWLKICIECNPTRDQDPAPDVAKKTCTVYVADLDELGAQAATLQDQNSELKRKLEEAQSLGGSYSYADVDDWKKRAEAAEARIAEAVAFMKRHGLQCSPREITAVLEGK